MPTYFGDADIQFLLDQFGVPVVVGAVEAKGVVDYVDHELVRGQQASLVGKAIVVRVKTNTFAGLLEPETPITIEGEAYKVRAALQEGDGGVTVVTCVKVT